MRCDAKRCEVQERAVGMESCLPEGGRARGSQEVAFIIAEAGMPKVSIWDSQLGEGTAPCIVSQAEGTMEIGLRSCFSPIFQSHGAFSERTSSSGLTARRSRQLYADCLGSKRACRRSDRFAVGWRLTYRLLRASLCSTCRKVDCRSFQCVVVTRWVDVLAEPDHKRTMLRCWPKHPNND